MVGEGEEGHLGCRHNTGAAMDDFPGRVEAQQKPTEVRGPSERKGQAEDGFGWVGGRGARVGEGEG